MSAPRLELVGIEPSSLELPAFVPSVSSLKTNLAPSEYVEVLTALPVGSEQLLVSAYDLERGAPDELAAVLKAVGEARSANLRIFLDSGNYEGYWRSDGSPWQEGEFHRALSRDLCDLAFSFDSHHGRVTGGNHVSATVAQYQRDRTASAGKPIVPIVHGTPEHLPALCAGVIRECDAQMIAVAERELGESIVTRLKTTREIRAAVDAVRGGIALHLLGTGNPTSIALFVAAGADCFDGLEWCQTVVDFESAALSHLSHYEFFHGQTSFAGAGVAWHLAVLAHNLEFMRGWVAGLRAAVRAGELESFCRLRVAPRAMAACQGVLWPA